MFRIRNKFFLCLAFVLMVSIISCTCYSTYVYADSATIGITWDELIDDLEVTDSSSDWSTKLCNYILQNRSTCWSLFKHLGGAIGAFFGTDSTEVENVMDDVADLITPDNVTVTVNTDNLLDSTVTFSKTITDTLISSLETVTEETDGYTLVKTVPISKIASSVYYTNSNLYYTLVNLAQNEGYFAACIGSNSANIYSVDVGDLAVFYKTYSFDSVKYNSYRFYDDIYTSATTPYYLYDSSCTDIVSSFDDIDSFASYNLTGRSCYFYTYDMFDAMSDYYSSSQLISAVAGSNCFLYSLTGFTIPVFDSLDDYVEYSIANGIYYTSSAYTGEGADITITLDDLSTVLDGYYDDMYDYLQQLIQEEGVTLNPEQLQILVDTVADSYGLLADATNAQTEAINSGFSGLISATENQTDVIEDGFNDIASYLSDIKDILEDSSSSSTSGEVTLDEEQLREILNAVGSSSDTVADVISAQTDVIDSGLSDVAESIDELKEIVSNLTLSSDSDGEVTLDEEQLQEILDAVNESYSLVVDATTEQTGILSDIWDILDDILSQLKKIKNWTIADTVTDAADAVADWADFITDFFSDIGSGVATVASGFSELGDTLSGKFPFSIPWDLAFLVGLLAADPEAPVFELPIYIPSYGIDVTYSVDFSQFAVLSQISRCLLTITFIFGLLKFTEKVINVKEDG